jgi:hypothetical protein
LASLSTPALSHEERKPVDLEAHAGAKAGPAVQSHAEITFQERIQEVLDKLRPFFGDREIDNLAKGYQSGASQ